MFPTLLAATSPLCRLPSTLHPKERGWLEGLRISFEMVDLSMRRLATVLAGISKNINEGHGGPELLLPAAFADAWSFVDSIWRIHELLDRPSIRLGRPGESPPARILEFKSAVRHFRAARNGIQHLDTKGVKVAEEGSPVWGTLHWIAHSGPDSPKALTCTMFPGPMLEGMYQVINPAGRLRQAPIDHVELRAFREVIEISKTYALTVQLARSFEESLGPQFEGQPVNNSDVVLAIVFEASP